MEALDGLAVAERDIRALSTARADSRPLSDYSERDPVSPFQSARAMFVGSATEHSTLRQPVRPNSPWWT